MPRIRVSFAVAGLLALAAVLPPAGRPAAQEKPAGERPAATFGETVRVEVVNVEVFATDRRGEPVAGLTAADFEIFEDGEPRPIVNFYAGETLSPSRRQGGTAGEVSPTNGLAGEGVTATEEPPPEQRLHLLILVDNTHLRPAHRTRVFETLRDFLDQRLEPTAEVAVASLGRSLRIHSDFLSDRGALGRILDDVEREASPQSGEDSERRLIIGEIFRGETFGQRSEPLTLGPLQSQIRAYIQREFQRGRATLNALSGFVGTLSGVPGRKAVLLIADGIARVPGEEMLNALAGGSETIHVDADREAATFDLLPQFQKLGREANASRVTLYSLDAAGNHVTEVRSAAVGGRVPSNTLSIIENNYREPQELVAGLTGGRRLEAGSRLDEDLDALARDFQNFYSLGFTPAQGGTGEVRRLRVEVKRPGILLRHRESYRRMTPEQVIRDATVAALLYGTTTNPLGVALETGQAQPREDGNTLLPVQVSVPVKSLALLPDGDHHTGQIALYVTTQGKGGEARPVQKIPFHARIPADKLEEARGRSLGYTLPVVVRSGDRGIAVGVRDEIGGTSSTSRVDLEHGR